MPIMDGIEASKIIRNLDSNIPIIALTANVLAIHVQQISDSGMNDYLAKPIEIEKLYKLLYEYLPISIMKNQRFC